MFGRHLYNPVPFQSLNEESDDSAEQDKDYVPHGIPSRQAIKPPADRYARRSKRRKEEDLVSPFTVMVVVKDSALTIKCAINLHV